MPRSSLCEVNSRNSVRAEIKGKFLFFKRVLNNGVLVYQVYGKNQMNYMKPYLYVCGSPKLILAITNGLRTNHVLKILDSWPRSL